MKRREEERAMFSAEKGASFDDTASPPLSALLTSGGTTSGAHDGTGGILATMTISATEGLKAVIEDAKRDDPAQPLPPNLSKAFVEKLNITDVGEWDLYVIQKVFRDMEKADKE